MKLGKYSIGIGDRFGLQGEAQLDALCKAIELGIDVTPVWNKSFREHKICGSNFEEPRTKADAAVSALDWRGSYFVDADHITLETVSGFIPYCDFFTIDVASKIGACAREQEIQSFAKASAELFRDLMLPGLSETFLVSEEIASKAARKYLLAVREAGRVFSVIADAKKTDDFAVEISMDEVPEPQTPVDMLLILKMIADESIPIQTIAPRFSGRFNKGVDYVGDVSGFEREFEKDILVLNYAVKHFGLPAGLKLSVHSGSDKFSLYPVINRLLKKHGQGVHLKTAGTTWLEEAVGLAASGTEAFGFVCRLYENALERIDELTAPYADVIDIQKGKLPQLKDVKSWSGECFARALRH